MESGTLVIVSLKGKSLIRFQQGSQSVEITRRSKRAYHDGSNALDGMRCHHGGLIHETLGRVELQLDGTLLDWTKRGKKVAEFRLASNWCKFTETIKILCNMVQLRV
jgi:predicted restriction endonuclease